MATTDRGAVSQETCPDCGRPFAEQLGPNSATPGCMRRLLGPGFFITERWLDCATRTAKRLETELASTRTENERLRKVIFPDLDAREPGLTRIRDWRCGDTGTVRYAEHSTRGWRVAISKGGALTSQAGGVDIPADVFAWLIRPIMLNLLPTGAKDSP